MPHVYTIDGAPVGRPQLVGSGIGITNEEQATQWYEERNAYRRRFYIASGVGVGLTLLSFIFGFVVGRKS